MMVFWSMILNFARINWNMNTRSLSIPELFTARAGKILLRSRQKQTQPDEIRLPQESSDQPGTSQSNNSPSQPANNIQNDSGQISLDTAKSKALADAGVAASEVTYTKARLEHDDGEAVYDIEFYTSAAKYDYEIDALTGMLRSKEAEAFGNMTDNTENSGNSSAYIGVDKAKSIASQSCGFLWR